MTGYEKDSDSSLTIGGLRKGRRKFDPLSTGALFSG
jgi:hypothetical protein